MILSGAATSKVSNSAQLVGGDRHRIAANVLAIERDVAGSWRRVPELEARNRAIRITCRNESGEIDIDERWKLINNNTKKLIIKSEKQLANYLLISERIAMYIFDSNTKYLIFREWIDFNVENEFRCFIYKKNLTAISQYDYGYELPKYMQVPALIVNTINHFFFQIKKLDIIF